jgi:16S rRNA pseudouridine516 synthase
MRRVDQLLSALGYCSRKQAQELCDDERVTVDGEPLARASTRVDPASVRVDGEPLDFPDGLLVMLHKPVGVVCSHDDRDGRLVYELLPERWRRRDPVVTTIGRLDKDTSGLLLLTDVGPLVHRLTSPKHHVPKVYRATLDAEPGPEVAARFTRGLLLEGDEDPTLPATLTLVEPRVAEVTVQEGRYHQVRRMFAACGRHVQTLHRVRFGEYELGALEPGQWRSLPLG